MRKELNGMYWDPNFFNLDIPCIGDKRKACAIFNKNLVQITWNCMRSLENNPTTLPQTETILKGQSVGGISIFDLMQVKNYGDGCKELICQLENNTFALSIDSASRIHNFVAKDEALEWGIIRTQDVFLHNINYVPPTRNLRDVLVDGFKFLQTVQNPKERAIGTFLFMSRNQPFFDGNKRTASLMMNGCLMNEGYFPITILNRDSEIFHKELGEFYETGNATPMFKFFESCINQLFSIEQRTEFPEHMQEADQKITKD